MGKKEKNKIFNNMKSLLNETTKEIKKEEPSFEKDITDLIKKEIFQEMSSDEKVVKILYENSINLLKIQVKNAIELGKVFSVVFDELGGEGSKYTGLYEKWLEVNGVSKSTALRYRKRYEIYNLVQLSKKNIIALLPQKYIELIYSMENRDEYIGKINEISSQKELVENLNKVEVIELKTPPVKIDVSWHVPIPNFLKFSTEVENKIESLDSEKKKELQKYLLKIEKILK